MKPRQVRRGDDLINKTTMHGNRYNDQCRGEVDTEEF